MITNEENMK